MFSSGGGGGPAKKQKKIFVNFFQHVKKLFNFGNFVNIKVAKSKLNHLGFYCKLDFFDRTIRKIRNWNRNWVLYIGISNGQKFKLQVNLWFVRLVSTSIIFRFFFLAAYPGPMVINVRTDEALKGASFSGPANDSQEAIQIVMNGRENGFRLTYSLNTNCFRTTNII